MNDTLQIMGDKQKEVERKKTAAEIALTKATETSEALKGERDMRLSLEAAIQTDKDFINRLQSEVNQLRAVAKNYVTLQEDQFRLQEKCREQEETLEELGKHLSASKLQVTELQEEYGKMTGSLDPPEATMVGGNWASDKDATNCKFCTKEFVLTRRKHHCRSCGDIFCNACSDNYMAIPPSTKQVRLCDQCYTSLLAKYSVTR